MIETLTQWDQSIFFWINQGWSSSFLDFLMPILRNKYTWLPFYLFLIVFSVYNLMRQGLWLIFCVIVAVGVSDTLSSKLIKNTVKRLRPCNTEMIQEQMELRVHCGSGYSFTSSHATNHFAVAVFLMYALGGIFKWVKWPLFFWALSIGLAQVYVGVHYPFDILAGSLLGAVIGYAFGHYYLRKSRKWFDQPPMAAV